MDRLNLASPSDDPSGSLPPTLGLIAALHTRGMRRMAVLLRHAARTYDDHFPQSEPFLPLTEQGKIDALMFGAALPAGPWYHFFSSPYGRCVETAHQIEKGCLATGKRTRPNVVAPYLAPFYLVDHDDIARRIRAASPEAFFQQWVRGELPGETIAPPHLSLKSLLHPIMRELAHLGDARRIDILVTHDSHVYLLRHGLLHPSIAVTGAVEYLEGVVLYWDAGAPRAIDHRATQPVAIPEEVYV